MFDHFFNFMYEINIFEHKISCKIKQFLQNAEESWLAFQYEI